MCPCPVWSDVPWIVDVLRERGVPMRRGAWILVTMGEIPVGDRMVLALVRDELSALGAVKAGAHDALVWPAEAGRLERVLQTLSDQMPTLRDLVRHRVALRASPVWQEFTDGHARIEDVSRGFEVESGYTRDEAIGRTPGELFRGGTHSSAYYREIDASVEQTGGWQGDLLGVRRDGSYAVVDLHLQARDRRTLAEHHHAVKHVGGPGEQGDLGRWLEERVGSPWLLVHAGEGRVIDASASIGRVFDEGRAALLGRAVDALPFDVPVPAAGGREVVDRTHGERVYAVDAVGRAVGGITLVHLLFDDVTERSERSWALDELARELREAVDAAVHADRAKTAFLETMSHELRTPLNAIMGYAELLQEEGASGTEELEHIRSAGRRLLGLVDEVLDLAQVERGDIVCSPEWVGVDELFADVVEANRLRAASMGKRLEVVCETREVWADPLRLHQVLANLVTNALKYGVEGRVRLVARAGILAVEDEGPGIPPSERERIFNAYRRLHEGGEGVGLGLALCQRLCHAMGSELELTDAEIGGSRFFVQLAERP